MTLANDKHQEKLRAAGWHSRGYLPHFDGIAIPQFITIHLADSLPTKALQIWRRELQKVGSERERIILQRRIEKYLDQGFGNAYLKDDRIVRYIENNPVKAGLCSKPSDWPYSSAWFKKNRH